MRRAPGISRFIAAPFGTKMMAFEAAFELLLARLNTLRSAKQFTSTLGELAGQPVLADPAQQERASAIGHIVELTARVMPFRAVCLQQVIALRRMLRRRNIPATVYLGVMPDADAEVTVKPSLSAGELPIAAHAWVTSGDKVVNGRTSDLSRYVVLGVFT